jgi:hypothetical protein
MRLATASLIAAMSLAAFAQTPNPVTLRKREREGKDDATENHIDKYEQQ